MKLRALLLGGWLLAWSLCITSASEAGTPTYNLRTEPALPVAGDPFQVVADGNSCELLFVGNPFGDGVYDEVTVSPGLIQAQVGYVATRVPTCDTAPHTVRLTIPAQPAGDYRVELIGRVLFSSEEGLLQAIDITVSGNGLADQPAAIPASGGSSLILLGLLMAGLVAALRPRGRQVTRIPSPHQSKCPSPRS